MAKRKTKLKKKLESLHAWNIGLLMAIWQTSFGKLLLCLATGLATAAVIIGVSTYNQGSIAAEHAARLLNEYEQISGLQPEAAVVAGAIGAPDGVAITGETYGGYSIIGKLHIERTGQQLPIIDSMDESALEMSCCYYDGALPGEAGNMVITGHNFVDGAIFGNLDLLIIGDDIILTTPDNIYRYEIYEFLEVKPDDTAALDEYIGDYVMTLMTCTNNGNRRLLVKCIRVDGDPV